LTNHNTRICNVIRDGELWLANSNYAIQRFLTLALVLNSKLVPVPEPALRRGVLLQISTYMCHLTNDEPPVSTLRIDLFLTQGVHFILLLKFVSRDLFFVNICICGMNNNLIMTNMSFDDKQKLVGSLGRRSFWTNKNIIG